MVLKLDMYRTAKSRNEASLDLLSSLFNEYCKKAEFNACDIENWFTAFNAFSLLSTAVAMIV